MVYGSGEAPRGRRQERNRRRRQWWRLALYLLGVLLVGLVSLALAVALYPLPAAEVPEATTILDHRGRTVTRLFVENRTPVPLADVPLHLRQAVVATEDIRFFHHQGIDPLAIARAAIRNAFAGRIVEGGSTITQQLAKNLFLSPERSFRRKFVEALLTLKLEMRFSKNEILEMYLNEIYFGHGAYGVEVAARTYFGKGVRELNLPESALLAGIIRSPERYSPYRDREAALARRELALSRMVEAGHLEPQEARAAAAAPLELADLPSRNRESAYFVQYVVDQVTERHPDLARDLFRGGFTVYTTLDLDMQRAAVRAFLPGLPEAREDGRGVLQPQGALVALDPATGFIRAMVGGRDFGRSQFNRAVQARRQPGSAFKPFVYVAVLDSGYTPASLQVCEPVTFPGPGGRVYRPTDYGEPYHYRPLTVREAVTVSDNVVAVRWMQAMTPGRVIRYARLMGIESPLEPSLALALGASEVTPLELAAAFSPLANMGYRVRPQAVLRVEDRWGNVIEENRPRLEKVLDERVAFLMTDIMQGVLGPGGTAGRAGSLLGRPAAGKTGTTQGLVDAWFVGYTPDLLAAVYVGNDDGETSVGASGGSLAAPIWATFMREALRGTPARPFVRPAGIVEAEVCPETGLLATDTSPRITELFIAGTEPVEECPDVHPATGEEEKDDTGEGTRGRPPGGQEHRGEKEGEGRQDERAEQRTKDRNGQHGEERGKPEAVGETRKPRPTSRTGDML